MEKAYVMKVDVVEGVAEFVKWFDSYEEAEEYAYAHDDGKYEFVPLCEDEEFYFN